MLQNADDKLFSLMFLSSHCLHTLLPDLKVTDIVLHNSGTSFNLPHCSYKLYRQSFVNTVDRCFFSRLLLTCFALWDIYAIWSDLICYHFSPHNWMAFVRLNKRHVMLCYVWCFSCVYGSELISLLLHGLSLMRIIPRSRTTVVVLLTTDHDRSRIGLSFKGCRAYLISVDPVR